MMPIDNPNQISLDQHAVIEASAGTGKTYTITHLVLRYLLEQQLSISQILLVTFTDKATSELKSRIHQSIKDKLLDEKTSPAEAVLLQQALRDMHLASIFTIHGFCQRVLKEYAFEQGSVLDKSLVDDNSVFIKQLQGLKRTWPAVADIEAKLEKSGLKMEALDKLLIDLAKQMKPGDIIFPDAPAEKLLVAEQALSDFHKPDQSTLKENFDALEGLTKRKKTYRWKKLNAAIDILASHQREDITFDRIAEDLPELKKLFEGVLSTQELKEVMASNSSSDSMVFFRVYRTIEKAVEAYHLAFQADRFQLVKTMVHRLQVRVKQHKVSQGQISYDDMISDLAAALAAESTAEEKPLTQRLRDKYQVALIDEFQDTDAQQWSIFQWLFTADKQAQRLILIGDPKQSIYGFRGANIHTYEAAKVYLMDSQRKGLGYRLSTNFRAMPALTQKLNQFFTYQSGENQAWYTEEQVEVSSPSESMRIEIGGPLVLEDDSGLSELNAITVEGEDLLVNGLKYKMAEQIARLIQQQLLGRMKFKRKQVEKTLDAGDVCVLVRSKADAKPIEQALDQLNVPHSFYKKTNLYQSEAAIQIQLVLTALTFPQIKKQVNNAWLSLFFDLSPAQIKQLNQQQGVITDDADLSDFMALWLKLKSLSAQQDWVAVFITLFEETGTNQRLYASGNWRLLANLQQIKQELLRIALDQQLDAHGMLHLLLSSRSSQLISQEDWQQKDTELPAVQIMTIHGSKGLEFPVVFLLGGYSALGKQHLFCKYHDPSIPAQVFNLAEKFPELYLSETEAENKRLYYVAMTRAVFKLFVPVYDASTYHITNGKAFYQEQVNNRLLDSQLASSIPVLDENFVAGITESTSQDELKQPPKMPELSVNVTQKSRIIHSFSSLQRQSHERAMHFGDLSQVDSDQADDVNPELLPVVDETPSIPGGAQTGNVLHGIFENIDFSLVEKHKSVYEFQQDQEVMGLIETQMKAFLMTDADILDTSGEQRSSYRFEFAAWVWHTLNKPIDALQGMRLCQLPAANRRHEMSFYWSHSGHVLTGFIDLLFKIESSEGDRYFILDWKSNFNPGGYAPQSLAEQVMQAHNYHEQYRLYTLAIKSWFNSLGLKNAQLSGALYLFSRGIDCGTENQNGVFYQDLSTETYSLSQLEKQTVNKIDSATLAVKGGG